MIASSKIVIIGGAALGAAAITGDQITAIVTAIGVIVFGVMAKRDSRDAARRAEEKDKISIAKIDTIHGLVNSSYGAQLKLSYGFAQRVADLTKDPADKIIAEETKKAYLSHEEKQKEIDAKKAAELTAALDKVKAEFAAKG